MYFAYADAISSRYYREGDIFETDRERKCSESEPTCMLQPWPDEICGKFDHDIRGPLLAIAAYQRNNNRVQEILQGISDEEVKAIIEHEYNGDVGSVDHALARVFAGDTRPYEGMALMCACQQGNVDLIKQLLVFGATINAQFNGSHATTLMLAVENGKTEAVQYLIQTNANLTAQDVYGRTALMRAIRSQVISPEKALPIIKMLIHPEIASIDEIDGISAQYCNPTEALELAAQEWESCPNYILNCCVKPFFIDNGINLQDMYGKTTLMWAVDLNEYDMAEYLLKSGADPSITDKSGKTAADYAEDPAIKSLLKKRKADQIS